MVNPVRLNCVLLRAFVRRHSGTCERNEPRALRSMFLCWTLLAMAGTSATAPAAEPPASHVYVVPPGSDVQFRLQQRLIEAVPGDTIQLEAGRYELKHQLDVVADNITIRGRGSAKTILSFRGQTLGGQGLEATGNNLVLEGFAVEDTAGNAVKVLGARNVTFRDLRAEWTGPASSANGAYGLYPVQCHNVLMEDCSAFGASDAGLYVGQCEDVIVRRCRAERNVAGIEIENTIHADVYENLATNNSGGLLVFDLPGLQVKAGREVRVYRNRVIENNHPNFADPGSTVASVPSGTGVMVLAMDQVEVFENEIRKNQTASILLISYLALNARIHDPNYDPIPEQISVHDNQIAEGGTKPTGALADLLKPVFGDSLADILWDGVSRDPSRPATLRIRDNGDARFVNFKLQDLTEENVVAGKYAYDTNLSSVQADMKDWPPVTLAAHEPPTQNVRTAVEVYRSLPKKLSEWGLFQGDVRLQHPADDVILYDLNAALYSDDAEKRRFLRLPPGTQATFHPDTVFDFPVGTVIAKTFSYSHDQRNPSLGERLLETRIEFRRESGWYGAAYLWNEQQTDATLALGGSELDVEWIDANGKTQRLHYQVPNANQCITCHNQDKKFEPLGPTARNLHRALPGDPSQRNQLEYLAERGLLRGFTSLTNVERMPGVSDATNSVNDRARAWLDVNCAHCHRPTGTARTSGLDLRWSQKDASQLGLWKRPTAAGHGSGGRLYDIVPGKPDESILLYRLETDDPSARMPNLGRQLVPKEGVELVREWIAEMR